jgi:hypothetical protein
MHAGQFCADHLREGAKAQNREMKMSDPPPCVSDRLGNQRSLET